MTTPETLRIAPQYAGYALGYALTSAWATVLLFSSSFSAARSETVVTLSMLSGVVACLGVLLFRSRIPSFDGRTGAASLCATGMAVGTLMCTYPALSGNPLLHDAGLVLSGFFAILLILTWFDVFARLEPRAIVLLSGCALLVSAVVCFVVLALPVEASSVAMAVLPLASLSRLPAPGNARANRMKRPSLGAIVREAVSWKTLLGISISFFVIGAIGTLAPQLGMAAQLSPIYLLIPAGMAGVFAATAFLAHTRIDASILFKLLLVSVAALAFLLVYYQGTNLSLVFFVYIAADVLLWTVLALSSKKTPVEAYAVFAIGWLAECAGNVVGHNVCALMGNTPQLFALVMLLILVAVGFAFGDGLFVLDLENPPLFAQRTNSRLQNPTLSAHAESENGENVQPHNSSETLEFATDDAKRAPAALETDAAGGRTAPTQEQSIAAFVERHGISAREADVFALWVTGHGQKYIQDNLFISESTVKTHLRSIYRKCSTHSRAEIIALFEEEQSPAETLQQG